MDNCSLLYLSCSEVNPYHNHVIEGNVEMCCRENRLDRRNFALAE